MTPYEISEPVLDIIFNDMENDGYFTEEVLSNFTIMDPTCGVGTLLIESANHFSRYLEKKKNNCGNRNRYIEQFRNKGMIGQDKVDRMVRLSKINALLLGFDFYQPTLWCRIRSWSTKFMRISHFKLNRGIYYKYRFRVAYAW